MLKATVNRDDLLRRVQIYAFSVHEAHLFLDTHPTDQAALAYFNKYNKLLEEATEEFEKQFGPLRVLDYEAPANKWEWVSEPWPWEMEA